MCARAILWSVNYADKVGSLRWRMTLDNPEAVALYRLYILETIANLQANS